MHFAFLNGKDIILRAFVRLVIMNQREIEGNKVRLIDLCDSSVGHTERIRGGFTRDLDFHIRLAN